MYHGMHYAIKLGMIKNLLVEQSLLFHQHPLNNVTSFSWNHSNTPQNAPCTKRPWHAAHSALLL